MGTKGSFPGGVKLTSQLHLGPMLKNVWSYTSTPAVCLHSVVLS